ncbi:MAG: alcohol dehydrogenase catalytic domain-containing protein [Lachnospiraceae bacterium]|nr:alcohol dehydrogenase catalytic domain-containing protein [Lachnospiraceae bacterium]
MKVVAATRIGNMKDPNPETRGTIDVIDIPEKELAPDEVKIKVAYCGICGSDPHLVDGCFSDVVPQPLGHECSGVIVELGPEATAKGLKVGDKVGGNFLGYCGKCYYCTTGMPEYCTNVGNQPCMGEYVVWNESQVCKLPEGVSLREGALMEPLSIAVRAMDKLGMMVGKTVLVSGGGPIGQLCCQLLAKFGAAELTLSEPNEARGEMAKRIGVEHVINPMKEDLYARGMEITKGIGYDVILEVSGVPAAMESVTKLAAKFATVLVVAQFPNGYKYPLDLFDDIYMKQITMTGMYCAHYNFERTAEYMKYVDLSDFTGDEQIYDLDDAKEAFEMHLTQKYPKILIRCNKFDGE